MSWQRQQEDTKTHTHVLQALHTHTPRYGFEVRDSVDNSMATTDLKVLNSTHLRIVMPPWGGKYSIDAAGVNSYLSYAYDPNEWNHEGRRLVDVYEDRPIFNYFVSGCCLCACVRKRGSVRDK